MENNNPLSQLNKVDDKEISDEEWNKFLKENYSHIKYGIPEKHTTAMFLRWRKEQG